MRLPILFSGTGQIFMEKIVQWSYLEGDIFKCNITTANTADEQII